MITSWPISNDQQRRNRSRTFPKLKSSKLNKNEGSIKSLLDIFLMIAIDVQLLRQMDHSSFDPFEQVRFAKLQSASASVSQNCSCSGLQKSPKRDHHEIVEN